MKKIFIILMIFALTSCTKEIKPKTPNEILLSIKDYSCNIKITCFSNKNSTEYEANQSYFSSGKYSMEFLDNSNLKFSYEESKLDISSKLIDNSLEILNYEELNKNPLFISYFIKTYFNMEDSDNIVTSNDSIKLILPTNNKLLYSATLLFKNNKPYSLTYFDKNGNEKVNIIYNEFTLIS